jgi:hypothetical protein
MRQIGSGTLRTAAELRQFQDAVVGPTLSLAASGRFTLRYTHKKSKVLTCSIQPKQMKPHQSYWLRSLAGFGSAGC